MPDFTFSSPDGQKYTIKGPDGATQEQAFQILQQHLGDAQKQADEPSFASGVVRSAARGVPVVGGLLNKADAATNAGLSYLMNPLFGEKDQLKGSFGERYRQSLQTQEGMDQAFDKAHPYVSTGAGIGGAVASLGGAAMTDLGAQALGLAAKTLPGAIAAGATSGAGIGALDAAARGEAVSQGAIFGGLGGAAGPVVGKAANAVIKPLARFARAAVAPEIEAAGQIRNAFEKDAGKGMTDVQMAEARARGQPVTMMDQGSRATERLARQAANFSPEAQESLSNVAQGRFATQSQRTADWLAEMGHFPDAHATQEALRQTSKTVNRTLYERAMAKGAGGVWNDNLDRLINHPWMKKAIPDALEQSNAERVLDGGTPIKNPFVADENGVLTLPKGTRPTLEFWDAIKKHIDGRVGGATATATDRGDPNTVRMGTNLLHALTGELDKEVPEYATARGAAKRFFGAQDALQAGRQTAMPGTSAARADNRVLRDALKKYSPAERKLFEQGFLDQTIETLLNKPDSFNVLRFINQSPRAKERMLTVLGQDRYAKLDAYLHVEGVMDRFRNAIGGNSTTAQQRGDMQSGSVVPNIRMSMSRMAEDFLIGAAKKLGAGIDERVAKKIADMLTSEDGAEYAKALRIISKNKNLLNAFRNPDAVTGLIPRGLSMGMSEGNGR